MYKCLKTVINFYSHDVTHPRKLSTSIKQTHLPSLSSPPSFKAILSNKHDLYTRFPYTIQTFISQPSLQKHFHCNHSGLTPVTTETHLSCPRISHPSCLSEISAPLCVLLHGDRGTCVRTHVHCLCMSV